MFHFELDRCLWDTIQWVLGIQDRKGRGLESHQVGETMNVYETPSPGGLRMTVNR